VGVNPFPVEVRAFRVDGTDYTARVADGGCTSSFAEAFKAAPWNVTDHDSWIGETSEQTRSRMSIGDDSLAPQADRLMAEISESLPATARRLWSVEVQGMFPCVPAVNAGLPESMFRLRHANSDMAPIRVAVDLTSSASINEQTLQVRGAGILALVRILSASRPVSLEIVSALSASGHDAPILTMRVETAPLDLATATWQLCRQGWVRRLGYGYLESHLGSGGGWCWGVRPTGRENDLYTRLMRSALALEPADLFIPATYCDCDWSSHPTKKIREIIDRFNSDAEAS
jgi:hypothetical protein